MRSMVESWGSRSIKVLTKIEVHGLEMPHLMLSCPQHGS